MSLIVAIDTGGTFTDLAACDTATGQVRTTKALTDYDDFVEGVAQCIAKARIDLPATEAVKFGTTLVINTFLQRNGARTALVTTPGFADVLHIRRGNRPVPFDLRFAYDPALVPRSLSFEVPERIDTDGNILVPLDEDAVDRPRRYAEPHDHPRGCRLLSQRLAQPQARTGRGRHPPPRPARRLRHRRHRTVARVVRIRTHLHRRRQRLCRAGGLRTPSPPAIAPARRRLRPRPLPDGLQRRRLLGPSRLRRAGVAGRIRARSAAASAPRAYAAASASTSSIAFDMGGTTAKCALVRERRASRSTSRLLRRRPPTRLPGARRGGRHRRGRRRRRLDRLARRGGPPPCRAAQRRLAPGPACYGLGGTEPTITDANLVLGRIDAQGLLGGEMRLDRDAAAGAVAQRSPAARL